MAGRYHKGYKCCTKQHQRYIQNCRPVYPCLFRDFHHSYIGRNVSSQVPRRLLVHINGLFRRKRYFVPFNHRHLRRQPHLQPEGRPRIPEMVRPRRRLPATGTTTTTGSAPPLANCIRAPITTTTIRPAKLITALSR